MRFIDKSIVLSTEYKAWEAAFEASQSPHTKYYSNHKYYRDIATALLHCQKGLCAYSELELGVDESDIQADKWIDGRYSNQDIDFFGQLDHFDETLKSKDGDTEGIKDWLWDNFFLVHSDINTKVKGKKAVDSILKPDRVGYDPFLLLSYDRNLHMFTPNYQNDALSDQDYKHIETMIEVLGLNYDPVLKIRRKYFTEILKDITDFNKPWEVVLYRFPTAFAMVRNELQAPQN